MRVILYTGKGGVGKTSVAAATALKAAEMGYKTIVISTDPAHSLADSFDIPLGAEPVPVAPNLWGQEVDVLKEMDRYWGIVREWLAALMRWQGADELVAEEMAVLPGMEELAGLLYIDQYAQQGELDLLVVDCAPTGETLRLLSFPETARWYMHRLFPVERKVAAAVGPVARGLFRVPVPGATVFDAVQDLFDRLQRMRKVLEDPSRSSVRLVVNPEKMVIKEAQRTFTYLNLYGYHTDLVVCNRVLPPHLADTFFTKWKESQSKYLQLIQECFAPIPILYAPLMESEVVGLDSLRSMGKAIFDSTDPVPVLYHGQSQEIIREGDSRILKVKLPFVSKEAVSLLQTGSELVVQIGNQRRNIVLPRLLAGLSVKEAKLNKDVLSIFFNSSTPAASSPKNQRR